MCGIFGIVVREQSTLSICAVQSAVKDLFRLSESRGKEAAGVAVLSRDAIRIFKEPVRASTLIRRPEYKRLFDDLRSAREESRPSGRATVPPHAGPTTAEGGRAPFPGALTIIGHSRLVTTGLQDQHANNQPVVSGGAVCIHNGIIVNDEDLWRAHPELPRHARVDSEVIACLIRDRLNQGDDLVPAVRRTFHLLRGAASIAALFDDFDALVLATNTGSLYLCHDATSGVLIFASEAYILRTLLARRYLARSLGTAPIDQVSPGRGCVVDLRNAALEPFSLDGRDTNGAAMFRRTSARSVVDVLPSPNGRSRDPSGPECRTASLNRDPQGRACLPRIDTSAIERLRRCTRCILPETMPMIEFDEDGVCNYCRRYRPNVVRGIDDLRRIVAPHARSGGRPNCLVGLSGGRDSTYALHFAAVELGLRPVAFTYDWGMVTDLARRNISRICGELGIEHILVSADIEKKRAHIRANVSAWLKRPELGVIPLFMAGDKQYFYHANKLKRQMNLPLILLGENMLERTEFKTGFCGVRMAGADDPDHAYTLSTGEKARLAAYYAGAYLRNPAYINRSLFDAAWGFACYYVINRDYLNLFRFIRWDEETITRTIRDAYDWEVARDTKSTWRIGDGTASFYNYIYFTVAGFSENDTFRSNQVRENIITRDMALALAREENRPRWASIQWYLDTIGLGDRFEEIVHRIDRIPKLYSHHGA